MRYYNTNDRSVNNGMNRSVNSSSNDSNKRTMIQLTGSSSLPPQRRRKLHYVNARENNGCIDCLEPLKCFAAASSSNDHHCIKRRKSVTFHEPAILSVTVLKTLTEEEHSSVWYSREEFSALQAAVRDAVKLFRKSNWTLTSKDQCRRGLEKYQLQYERKRMERQHFDAVLSEQKRQRENGMLDDELLCQASLMNSSWALQNAQRTAQYDALVCQHLQQQQCQQRLEQQQRYSFFFDSQQHDDSRTVLETFDSYDEEHDRTAADNAECFQHLASLFAASRRPTPPPPMEDHSRSNGPAEEKRTTVVVMA
jgi:hypothetical protein